MPFRILNPVFFFLGISILLSCYSVQDLPPQIDFKTFDEPLSTVQVLGFDARVGYAVENMAFRDEDKVDQFIWREIEVPKYQAKFIQILKKAHLAKYYTHDDIANFIVNGKQIWSQGGVKGTSDFMFTWGRYLLFFWLCPWKEQTKAIVEIEILDKNKNVLIPIQETGEITYRMWFIPFFQGRDPQKGYELRERLFQRAAARTLIQLEDWFRSKKD